MIKQLFNDDWTLKHEIKSIMQSMSSKGGHVEQVTLPHDAMLNLPRNADSVGGPGMAYFEGEDLEYSKDLYVPASEKETVHYLNFDGVYRNAALFVNNTFVCKHRYGYTPFSVRIDEYLKYDQNNHIKVEVRGSAMPNSRWYPGLGIYRDVNLLTGNYLHIADDGIHVTTVDCDSELAVLEVDILVQNEGACSREAYAELTILNQNGEEVAARKARFYLKANDHVTVRQRIDLENPRLWNVDAPNLYTCRCRLVERESGEKTDTSEAVFGVRKLQLDARRGLRINGVPVKLKGGCVHHDNGLLGSASLPDAEERRVRIHKEGGYNAIRTSHNPPSRALLDACDKLGLLVMHEFTDIWTESKSAYDYADFMPDTWEEDVEAVVRRDYNHPSVIMWSIGNEIPETGNSISTQWGRKLVEKFHDLDHTRFVTNGINVMVSCIPYLGALIKQRAIEGAAKKADGVNDVMNGSDNFMDMFGKDPTFDPYVEESCDMLDLIGYNYTTSRYEREHKIHPDWIMFGSETYSGALDENWEVVSRNPYVIGDFAWTSMDYLGEVGCGRIEQKEGTTAQFTGDYPWLLASDGDFDLTGYRRPMSYWRQTVWGGRKDQPYIAVHRMQNYGKDLFISNWNFTDAVRCWRWDGYEGKLTSVEVYSDADEVELFLNGRSLGKKTVGAEFKKFYCRWETAYEPGKLEAVAYRDGKEVGRDVLKTAGDPVLTLTADKKTLRAGSQDLCYVEIELKDQDGNLNMTADRTGTVAVDGPAILAGCGTANPRTEERYNSNEHPFFEGRMMAILKAGNTPGKATVTVRCPGMEPASLELEIL